MISQSQLDNLRVEITDNIRVQIGSDSMHYINVGNALTDARAKQNHTIFARRGCGKTLLLHHSGRTLSEKRHRVYLNCEDFKQHSFPNVLIEILHSVFREIDSNLVAWFGKKKALKHEINAILKRLDQMRMAEDARVSDVVERSKNTSESNASFGASVAADPIKLSANLTNGKTRTNSMETRFKEHQSKLRELDLWLPRLKEKIRAFFSSSDKCEAIFIQIDDLYHLRRMDQAFVVDYIHRLCKDVPLFFKIATLRHASVMYVDREGQPIGAQERHDYQPIDIDYSFSDFAKTRLQNWNILIEFARRAKVDAKGIEELFKGEGFSRLVMAGGGVPRDVLSLFLDILSETDVSAGQKIGKDEVRIKSRSNFERRIEELKQDSKENEQGDLLKAIYIIRHFCLTRQTNVFCIEERVLQTNEVWRALIYRLLDYRIIHHCASAFTHKSKPGSYQAFAIDIGCYAHLRKLDGKFKEIDVSVSDAKERMRSAPILDEGTLGELEKAAPNNFEAELFAEEE